MANFNPSIGIIKLLPKPKAKDDCLQKEQLSLWFDGVKKINNPVICVYLQILILTGARREELASLKWIDIDLRWRTVVIKDKVEGTRQIPITPYVWQLLNTIPRHKEYVFFSKISKSGRIQEPRIAHNKALDLVGLPHLSIHGLRRSFGTLAEWVECPSGISVCVRATHIESVAVQGDDGVHQELKWTPWNTPNYRPGVVTATS